MLFVSNVLNIEPSRNLAGSTRRAPKPQVSSQHFIITTYTEEC